MKYKVVDSLNNTLRYFKDYKSAATFAAMNKTWKVITL